MSSPSTQTTLQEKATSSLRMVLTMGGIGLFCGILIVLTYQVTYPVIQVNKARALEKAIFEVVPNATSKAAFKVVDGRLVEVGEGDPAEQKYYACYDDRHALVGVAIEASGQGFQDVLRLIYGYEPASSNIVGLKVLESKETPGLGDKIEKDPAFRSNFNALEVELSEDGNEIANPITLAKKGEKEQAWEVESITGATISSRAVTDILKKSTEAVVPVIGRNLQVLKGGGENGGSKSGD